MLPVTGPLGSRLSVAEGKAALLKSAQPCTQISEGGEFRGRVRDDAIREVSKKKRFAKVRGQGGDCRPVDNLLFHRHSHLNRSSVRAQSGVWPIVRAMLPSFDA